MRCTGSEAQGVLCTFLKHRVAQRDDGKKNGKKERQVSTPIKITFDLYKTIFNLFLL